MDIQDVKQGQARKETSIFTRMHMWWESFTASPMRCLLLALGFSIVFCAITELTWVKADLNDDYTIASVLSGRLLGDDQGLCLFLNAILCHAIYALNTAFPQFNWFAVLELVTVFVSYAVICYLAIRHLPMHLSLLVVALVAYYSLPGCFTIDNFTYVAFICSCAGCMLLARSLIQDRHGVGLVVFGLLLLSLGSLWRNIMAWLCVPVFGIAAIGIVAWKHSGGLKLGRAIARLWPFFLAVIIGFGLTVYDLAVWKASPWDTWRSFNDERSMLSDFPHYKYQDVQDELQALGVSENDYALLFSWTTEDPDFFTAEKIEAITDIAIIDWKADKTPGGILKNYAKGVLDDSELLVLLLAAALSGLLLTRGRGRAWSLAVLAMACLMALFFSAMGRLPERVHYPIWLYAICAVSMLQMCYGWAGEVALDFMPGRHVKGAAGHAGVHVAVGLAFALVAFAPLYAAVPLIQKCADNFYPQRIALTFDVDSVDMEGAFTAYIHDHPDKVFVLHNSGHRQLRMEHYLKGYYDDDLQSRVISLGGWLSRSPYASAKNAAAGMENPIKGLAQNENVLLVVSSKEQAQKVQTYLQEHYYPDATAELVDTLKKKDGYKTKLYVYRFAQSRD